MNSAAWKVKILYSIHFKHHRVFNIVTTIIDIIIASGSQTFLAPVNP